MSTLRVHSFAIAIDGYGAGPGQDAENPLGQGGKALHEWIFATRTFQQMFGDGSGTTGIDDVAFRSNAGTAPRINPAHRSRRNDAWPVSFRHSSIVEVS